MLLLLLFDAHRWGYRSRCLVVVSRFSFTRSCRGRCNISPNICVGGDVCSRTEGGAGPRGPACSRGCRLEPPSRATTNHWESKSCQVPVAHVGSATGRPSTQPVAATDSSGGTDAQPKSWQGAPRRVQRRTGGIARTGPRLTASDAGHPNKAAPRDLSSRNGDLSQILMTCGASSSTGCAPSGPRSPGSGCLLGIASWSILCETLCSAPQWCGPLT